MPSGKPTEFGIDHRLDSCGGDIAFVERGRFSDEGYSIQGN